MERIILFCLHFEVYSDIMKSTAVPGRKYRGLYCFVYILKCTAIPDREWIGLYSFVYILKYIATF